MSLAQVSDTKISSNFTIWKILKTKLSMKYKVLNIYHTKTRAHKQKRLYCESEMFQ